jgi:hypothetical protein
MVREAVPPLRVLRHRPSAPVGAATIAALELANGEARRLGIVPGVRLSIPRADTFA